MKHSIVDYILMDESEKKRLSITKTPEFYQPIVVRSPVPWSLSFSQAQEGFHFKYSPIKMFYSLPSVFTLGHEMQCNQVSTQYFYE